MREEVASSLQPLKLLLLLLTPEEEHPQSPSLVYKAKLSWGRLCETTSGGAIEKGLSAQCCSSPLMAGAGAL
jgi:hypothetical protein